MAVHPAQTVEIVERPVGRHNHLAPRVDGDHRVQPVSRPETRRRALQGGAPLVRRHAEQDREQLGPRGRPGSPGMESL